MKVRRAAGLSTMETIAMATRYLTAYLRGGSFPFLLPLMMVWFSTPVGLVCFQYMPYIWDHVPAEIKSMYHKTNVISWYIYPLGAFIRASLGPGHVGAQVETGVTVGEIRKVVLIKWSLFFSGSLATPLNWILGLSLATYINCVLYRYFGHVFTTKHIFGT